MKTIKNLKRAHDFINNRLVHNSPCDGSSLMVRMANLTNEEFTGIYTLTREPFTQTSRPIWVHGTAQPYRELANMNRELAKPTENNINKTEN